MRTLIFPALLLTLVQPLEAQPGAASRQRAPRAIQVAPATPVTAFGAAQALRRRAQADSAATLLLGRPGPVRTRARFDSAAAAYLEVVRTWPRDAYADSALAQLRSLAAGAGAAGTLRARYQAALGLEELGFHQKAVDEVRETARANPGLPVPPAARALLADSTNALARTRRFATATVIPWAEVILVAGLLGWLVLRLLIIPFVAKPRLELSSIEPAGGAEGAGLEVTAMVLQRVDWLTRGAARGGGHAGSANVVQGPVDGLPLESTVRALLPAQPWVQALPGLLKWLSGRPVVRLRGQLHSGDATGLGITLLMTRGPATVESHTLWAREFGGPGGGEMTALAEAAAVWLVFHAPVRWTNRNQPPFERMGTSDWRSYALFRAGVRAMVDLARSAEAERLFRRALDWDLDNRGARVNLGTLMLEKGKLDHGIELLKDAWEACKGAKEPWRDSTAYPALYRLAVGYYHKGLYTQARETVETLHGLIADMRTKARKKDADWKAYVDSIQPAADSLYAGIRAKLAATPAELAKLAGELEAMGGKMEAPAGLYNLACSFWIILGSEHGDWATKTAGRDGLLKYLERACEGEPSYAEGILTDPSLSGIDKHPMVGAWVTALVGRFARPKQASAPTSDPPAQVVKLFVAPLQP